MRTYAQDTTVPISKSRCQIDKLLHDWGCFRLGWFDDFEKHETELHFHWRRKEEEVYQARFSLKISIGDQDSQKVKERKQRAAFRVLYLWIKAALNACDAGIVDPATIFLPFLVGQSGQTFGEVALPRLPELLSGSAERLLPAPETSQ